jgi:AraC-like DNA-binding protein
MSSATACIKAIRICILTAAQSGLSPVEAAKQLEIDAEILQDPNARVHHTVVLRAWDELPKVVGDSTFGLRAAELVASSPFDIVDYVAAQAPDMRRAIDCLVRYQRLLHEDAEVQVFTEDGEIRIQQRLRSVPRAPRHFAEFVVAIWVLRGRALSGKIIPPRRVYFQHGPPENIDAHRRIFAAPLEFLHPHNGVSFAADFQDLPVRGSDPALGALLERHATDLLARLPQRDDVVSRLKAGLFPAIANEVPTMETIAKTLGMSARTLQRALQAENTTYQDVLDEVRRDLALEHLRDPQRTISEIAFLVGFVEVGAFTRAFKRWTGENPSTYRKRSSA